MSPQRRPPGCAPTRRIDCAEAAYGDIRADGNNGELKYPLAAAALTLALRHRQSSSPFPESSPMEKSLVPGRLRQLMWT